MVEKALSFSTLSAWFQGLEPGAKGALGFVLLIIVLSVYAIRHWAKRREALLELMPRLGFVPIDEPPVDALVPNLMFHANGFESSPFPLQKRESLRRVPLAWRGHLGDYPVVVMDVSTHRQNVKVTNERDTAVPFNRTVLRCEVPAGSALPDLLIDERVLFKGQIRGQRSIGGVDHFGKHYYLFSDASEQALTPWISPPLQAALDRFRLWKLATHDGVVYLQRGSSREEPKEIDSFLREGGTLLNALLSAARS